MVRVFVYGTLKRGQPNHYLIADEANGKATFIGEGKTVKKYPLVIASECNLPFLLPVEGTGKIVQGEVYEVDEHMLEYLDELEYHPIWYKREEIEIELKNEISTFWCYFLEHFRPELLCLTFMEQFDCHSLPEGKKYVAPSARGKTKIERENVFHDVITAVKLPEYYISHQEYISHKFKDK